MPLGIEVGLGPRHIVLDGDPAPPKGPLAVHRFSAHVHCGQTPAWTKMPLRTEVGISPGHIVLNGDPALPRKGNNSPPIFGLCVLWRNGCIQDATWYEIGVGPGYIVLTGTQLPGRWA